LGPCRALGNQHGPFWFSRGEDPESLGGSGSQRVRSYPGKGYPGVSIARHSGATRKNNKLLGLFGGLPKGHEVSTTELSGPYRGSGGVDHCLIHHTQVMFRTPSFYSGPHGFYSAHYGFIQDAKVLFKTPRFYSGRHYCRSGCGGGVWWGGMGWGRVGWWGGDHTPPRPTPPLAFITTLIHTSKTQAHGVGIVYDPLPWALFRP
jgi:hypothetical protein